MEYHYNADPVGEKTGSADSSFCFDESCRGCTGGYCTALEIADVIGPCSSNRKEIWKCFYRLIDNERFDLLRKYADTLADFGLMDQELEQADRMRSIFEVYREEHLKELGEKQWKDTLIPSNENDADDDIEEDEAEPEQFESESVFDSSIDHIEAPVTVSGAKLDVGLMEDIGISYEYLLKEAEETDLNKLADEYAQEIFEEEASERALNYEEIVNISSSYSDDEDDPYGSTVSRKNIPSYDPYWSRTHYYPVWKACSLLGANIVYKAAEDYTLLLRMLWNGNHSEHECYLLLIEKWKLETFFGSPAYWRYTDVRPCRILDRCHVNAQKLAIEKIERVNRRIAAGIEVL